MLDRREKESGKGQKSQQTLAFIGFAGMELMVGLEPMTSSYLC